MKKKKYCTKLNFKMRGALLSSVWKEKPQPVQLLEKPGTTYVPNVPPTTQFSFHFTEKDMLFVIMVCAILILIMVYFMHQKQSRLIELLMRR
jgi:hypothetical protein